MNRFLAKIIALPKLKKIAITVLAILLCLLFSVLGQHGIPLYTPFEALFLLSIVGIIMPLISGLFIYRAKWAKILLASSLIASFCALTITVDMQFTTQSLEKKCQRMPDGFLHIQNGAAQCMWSDGVSEGRITRMGSVSSNTDVLILPLLGAFLIGLCNVPALVVALIFRRKTI